jgi:hypothetical protein
MEPRLSVNRVLDVLIRRLRKECLRPNSSPIPYQKFYADGFRAAVQRIEAYRRALHERYPEQLTGRRD